MGRKKIQSVRGLWTMARKEIVAIKKKPHRNHLSGGVGFSGFPPSEVQISRPGCNPELQFSMSWSPKMPFKASEFHEWITKEKENKNKIK